MNDSMKFLINGHYSQQLWLTQGVKQGINNPFKSYEYQPKIHSRVQPKSTPFLNLHFRPRTTAEYVRPWHRHSGPKHFLYTVC